MSCLPVVRAGGSRLKVLIARCCFGVLTLCAAPLALAATSEPSPPSAPPPVRFAHPLVFVRDASASKRFYRDVVGLKVLRDHGRFVLFQDNFAIHEESLIQGILGAGVPIGESPLGRKNLEVYFESPDIDATYERIKSQVTMIHPVLEQYWGQRVFRFFDPDGHIVEIGEPSFLEFPE